MNKLGTCINEDLIEELFGSVSHLACLIEEHGDEFQIDDVHVTYNPETDIHTFWSDL